MPTVLRNGRVVASADEPAMEATYLKKDGRSAIPKPSPYLLLIYPIILAAGTLFSVLSPIASPPAEPLAPGVASNLHTHKYFPSTNYFAGKHNLINLYFVKIGWLWTTLAFVALQLTTRPPPLNKQKHYIQAATRYALVTISWMLVTQWFFGPALIDRSFTITGGHCEAPPSSIRNMSDIKDNVQLSTLSTSLTCKAAGGRWRGGHDISGHIFMLVLSSAFLLYELYISDTHSTHPHVSPAAAAKLAHDLTDDEKKAMGGWESESAAQIRVWSRRLLWGVVGLDFWMIMMTAIWFHTWLEKLSGLMLAGATVWAVYFLGEFAEGWRPIVGGFD